MNVGNFPSMIGQPAAFQRAMLEARSEAADRFRAAQAATQVPSAIDPAQADEYWTFLAKSEPRGGLIDILA